MSEDQQDLEGVRWAYVDSPAFSVEELLASEGKDDLMKEGIKIDQIPESSLLHAKKQRNCFKHGTSAKNVRETCFMQLTFGEKVMVYDLDMRQRCEVAMIDQLNDYDSPITFSHTGFLMNTNERRFDTNISCKLGVVRPCNHNLGKSVFRAFSEVEIQQLKSISDLTFSKGLLSKSDVKFIEP